MSLKLEGYYPSFHVCGLENIDGPKSTFATYRLLAVIVEPKSTDLVKGLLSNAAIKQAAVEKGIEVAGKMIDKKLQIINEAQEKAETFLDTGVRHSFYIFTVFYVVIVVVVVELIVVVVVVIVLVVLAVVAEVVLVV